METITTLVGNPERSDAPADRAASATAGSATAANADHLPTEELLRRLREAGL